MHVRRVLTGRKEGAITRLVRAAMNVGRIEEEPHEVWLSWEACYVIQRCR